MRVVLPWLLKAALRALRWLYGEHTPAPVFGSFAMWKKSGMLATGQNQKLTRTSTGCPSRSTEIINVFMVGNSVISFMAVCGLVRS